MGLFDFWKRSEPRAEAKNYTILDLANEIGWPTSPGITPTTSLQSVTVMRCVGLLGGLLASFPVDVMRKAGRESDEVDGHDIDRLFNVEMNTEHDSVIGRWVMNANLLLSGNAVAVKVTSRDRIAALWPIRHDLVTFDRLPNGDRVYRITGSDGKAQDYTQDQVYHEALWSLDGFAGLSPVQQAKARLAGHISAEKLQTNLYENKPMPGMVIKYKLDLNQEKREALQKALKDQYSGYMQGRPLVMSGDPSVDFPAIPLTDMQWLESINAGEEQIAQMFGIPPHALGILRKTTSWGSGIEQLNIGFLQYTIQPLLTLKEAAMRRQLMTADQKAKRYFVRHNVAALLRSDVKSQADALAAQVQGGIMTPNEARAKLDMAPAKGGDELYMQQQMVPLNAPRSAAPDAPDPVDSKESQVFNIAVGGGKRSRKIVRDGNGRIAEVIEDGE